MIIIGEKLNSSIKSFKKAVEDGDEKLIAELVIAQTDAGVDYIDINANTFTENEAEKLLWLADIVQKNTDTKLCIASQDRDVISSVLKTNIKAKPLINAITNVNSRFEAIAPLITEYDTSIIALCIDDEELPETVDERVSIAESLVEKLSKRGVKAEDIFIDPFVRPVGTGAHYGVAALESIKRLKEEFPQCHITCGISNISFGIPARKLMNQTFLVAAMAYGVDAALLDPLDKRLMSLMLASDALLGRDEFCMNYISHYREGALEG